MEEYTIHQSQTNLKTYNHNLAITLTKHFPHIKLHQQYFMNSSRPVELAEKIDYLNEKISQVHWQTRKSDDFQLRLNFEEYIDSCIGSIISIKDKSVPSHKKTSGVDSPVGKIYSAEKQQLEMEKKMLFFQMQEMQAKQKNLQYETLQVKMLSKEKQIEKLRKIYDEERRENIKQTENLKGRCRFLEQEIQKLTKLNQAQQNQIQKQREERNQAQSKYLEIRDKYQQEMGILQKFGDKKPKYLDRNTEGLKCAKYFTNTGVGDGKGTKHKIVILALPTVIEVNKIVYGVMLGVQASNKQILYYDRFQLYERQIAHISVESAELVIQYKRRKTNSRIILDKFQVRTPQIVIMLYGKGDSIIVHE